VDGRCDDAAVDNLEPSDLVEAILSATTDEHRFESGPGYRSFSILKHRADLAADSQRSDGNAPQASGEDGSGLE
jgi:hypothetical protein